MIKHINEINFAEALDDSDLIRISNFYQTEFAYYSQYEFNNRDGLIEIIDNYDMDINEIIDLLFKNKDLKRNDDFLYYDAVNRHLQTLNRKSLFNEVMSYLEKQLCNGEFKEIVEECLGYEITY